MEKEYDTRKLKNQNNTKKTPKLQANCTVLNGKFCFPLELLFLYFPFSISVSQFCCIIITNAIIYNLLKMVQFLHAEESAEIKLILL